MIAPAWVTPELGVCAALALGLGRLRARQVLVGFLLLPGTVAHELAHWVVAVVLWADPGPPHLIPYRQADGAWVLGHVNVSHLRWWNAAPVALAPLGLLAGTPMLCAWAHSNIAHGHWGLAAAQLYAAAAGLCSAWPSAQDWRVARRSAFAVVLFALCAWMVLRSGRL